MYPISSPVSGGLASLMNLSGTATVPVARNAATGSQDVATTGVGVHQADDALGIAAVPAMVSQILSALRASFSINPTSSPAANALTPAENADQSFTSALAQAVQAGDGSAAALDAVRNTILQALNDVSQFLLGTGTAPADVNAAGSSLQGRLESLMSGLSAGGAVAAQGTLVQKEKATLQIRTAEGDIVTLSLRARSTTTASFAAGSAADGGAVGTANVTTINGARLSIDVQGDINPAEAAAIGAVLKQVEALASQFFAGDVAQAFASAAALNVDSSQLASVALQLRFKESFSAAAVMQSVSAAPAAPATPAPASPPADASSPPAPAVAAPATADTAPAPAPADPAAGGAPAPTIASVLQDFLSRMLDFALAGSGDQTAVSSAHLRLQLLLAATRTISLLRGPADGAVPNGTPTSPTSAQAAVAKLGSVVDSLGSRLA